jgi:hypothetical protein
MQPGSGVSVNQGDSNANTGFNGTHSHTGTTGGVSSNHTHPVTIPSSGGHSHSISGSTGSHDHPGSSVTGTGAHVHSVDLNGVSGTNLNLPPYFALFYIMRLV